MMGLLIYKYEPFWQEVIVKSLILRWLLRPVGLLLLLILDVWIHTQYFLAQNLFLQAYGADDDRTLAIKGEVLM